MIKILCFYYDSLGNLLFLSRSGQKTFLCEFSTGKVVKEFDCTFKAVSYSNKMSLEMVNMVSESKRLIVSFCKSGLLIDDTENGILFEG